MDAEYEYIATEELGTGSLSIRDNGLQYSHWCCLSVNGFDRLRECCDDEFGALEGYDNLNDDAKTRVKSDWTKMRVSVLREKTKRRVINSAAKKLSPESLSSMDLAVVDRSFECRSNDCVYAQVLGECLKVDN